MKKRAQAAMEYLLIGSLITLIIIPTLYIFYGYSQTSNEEIRQSQLNKVGTDIVSVAEQVYYLGEPSRVTIDATMPSSIIGVEVWKNQELVFFLNDGSEVAFKSKVTITTNQACNGERCFGNFTERFYSPGLKRIIIEAKKDHVFIREAGDDQTEQTVPEEELFYCDEDDDSYYAIESSSSCPSGRIDTEPGDDCDDSKIYINPGVDEVCDDDIDNDCDGKADCDDQDCEGDPACLECECSSGPCCDGCYYKASGSQPTGFTDDTNGFCTGTNGPTSTSYVYTRNYYCNGIDANEHHTDTLRDTCGTCKYCTDNDLTCNYYAAGTDTGTCRECNGAGSEQTPSDDSACGTISCDDWHHQVGSDSATGTNYCYDSPDITSIRCEGLGDCKDANTADCGSADDTLEVSCGVCKYVNGCSGTTDGYCSNYAAGISCGTNQECDGNGNCVSACECSSGPCCDGCYYKPAGTVCDTKDCDYLDTTCRNYHDKTLYCTGSSTSCPDTTCDSFTDADTSTRCWTGDYGSCGSCSYSSTCDESASGTKWRDYKTCSAGSCSVSGSESASCTCSRDTDGKTCSTTSSTRCASSHGCSPSCRTPYYCSITATLKCICIDGICSTHCSTFYSYGACC